MGRQDCVSGVFKKIQVVLYKGETQKQNRNNME